MSRLCLYYLNEPERDRWVPGDRFVRPVLRRLLRGKPRPGGVDKVFINLCLGLDRLGIAYEVNLPFRQLRPDDRVAVLGRGRHCLDGYAQPNVIVAGIGLMTDPSEWPTLCTDFPVVRYLQHCAWCDAVYRPYFGDRCAIWPVGIDTRAWCPANAVPKQYDFLIYDKVRWDRDTVIPALVDPIRSALEKAGLTAVEIRYGAYAPEAFRQALQQSRAMIFLCEHESQGIAAQEAMASGVPLFTWDPGFVADPERFKWGRPVIPSTSVPYFDSRCGMKFRSAEEFAAQLPAFLAVQRAGRFAPRDYILENLTVEKCAGNFVDIVNSAQSSHPTV
jgi:glycosyltransferase involved in cell wall biosynthesis